VHHGANLPCRAAIVILASLASACGARAQVRPSASTVAAIERAEARERIRDHQGARRHYLDAIAAAPDRPSERFARHEFADTLNAWGEFTEMANQLEAIVGLDPEDASAWHDLGLVRHKLGDDRRAIASLTRARDLARKDYRPRIALAALYWTTGQFTSALTEYVALTRLDLPDRLAVRVRWAIDCLSGSAAAHDCPRNPPAQAPTGPGTTRGL